MKAIALTGLPRSGKDSAADYLVESHGFKKLVLSDEIGEELRKQGLPDDKMQRSRMGKQLRERLGDEIVAKRAFERAEKNGFEKVVFVGLRSPGEVQFFKKKIAGFKLVNIEAGKEKRFERKSKRDAQGRQQFFERDKWELEKFGLSKVISQADYTIQNNSTINDFHKAIDELMQKI